MDKSFHTTAHYSSFHRQTKFRPRTPEMQEQQQPIEPRATRQGEKFTVDPSFHKTDFSHDDLTKLVLSQFSTSSALPPSNNNNSEQEEEEEDVTLHQIREEEEDDEEDQENGHTCYQAWDQVYQSHKNKIFPIKNYISKCFPELLPVATTETEIDNNDDDDDEKMQSNMSNMKMRIMECGCGTGSCLFPLVMQNGASWHFVACDFSSQAIETLKSHELYEKYREQLDVFVWDVSMKSNSNITETQNDDNEATNDTDRVLNLYSGSIDKVLLVFVLSAMPTISHMKTALNNIWTLLKPNGVLLFRDYGKFDMAHTRFLRKLLNQSKSSSQISETDRQAMLLDDRMIFKRDDGTFSFFYSTEFCQQLFTECGFRILELEYHCVKLRNKKTELDMYRVFIHGIFQKIAS